MGSLFFCSIPMFRNMKPKSNSEWFFDCEVSQQLRHRVVCMVADITRYICIALFYCDVKICRYKRELKLVRLFKFDF